MFLSKNRWPWARCRLASGLGTTDGAVGGQQALGAKFQQICLEHKPLSMEGNKIAPSIETIYTSICKISYPWFTLVYCKMALSPTQRIRKFAIICDMKSSNEWMMFQLLLAQKLVYFPIFVPYDFPICCFTNC